MNIADLHLRTCFVLNGEGRIVSTREPGASPGPFFTLVRSAAACAWAVRTDVGADLARELDQLARDEPATSDLRAAPVHTARYISLLATAIGAGDVLTTKTQQSDGPTFAFPRLPAFSDEMVMIEDERLLQHHFRGWIPGEIDAGRSPVLAIVEDGEPVSICFCARTSDDAAEAGVETAEGYRGRGYGPRVAAAWAQAIYTSGRTPLYSTGWTNYASLAVARKLRLVAYASSWDLSD